jgi:hypothetical protein
LSEGVKGEENEKDFAPAEAKKGTQNGPLKAREL